MQPDAQDANAPSRWMDNARADLALAQISLPKGVQYEQLCFHAQQAAEKSLKAVLLKCKVDFPLTHNLQALLNLLQGCVQIPIELRNVVDLNPYAVVTRYPGETEPVTKDDYLDAVRLATLAVRWAESIIGRSEQ
jgi:HEPN domain-containing protein